MEHFLFHERLAQVIVTYTPARMRQTFHAFLVLLLAANGWFWFGNAGIGLFMLWGRATRPASVQQTCEIHLARVKEIRLYSRVLIVRAYRGDPLWLFADEMPAPEFAGLRRVLKAQIEGLI
jgi:hypothetical protein